MEMMKKLFTIIVCKVLKFVGGLLGKGSSLPGQIALKLCPDILGRIELPKYIVAVTGSNGKTSTVEMIAHILCESGKKVAWNKEGSNQIEGVTTLILGSCIFRARLNRIFFSLKVTNALQNIPSNTSHRLIMLSQTFTVTSSHETVIRNGFTMP